MFFPKTPAPPIDCQRMTVARFRAESMFFKVARLHAEGDHFAPERLELLRLLKVAMGLRRSGAGELLTSALAGDPLAEPELLGHLQRIIYDAG